MDLEDDEPYNYWSYDDIVRSWGYDIIAEEVFGDWQGDYIYLLRDWTTNRWAVLVIGYGSCSGCDALEACDSNEDREELAQKLYSGIRWETAEELVEEVANLSEPITWYSSDEEWIAFTKRAPVLIDLHSRLDPGGYIDIPDGWVDLVCDLHNAIVSQFPDYRVVQIKEKFGGLRFYTDPPILSREVSDLIQATEAKSYTICAETGEPGSLHERDFIYRTLSPKEAARRGFTPSEN